MKETRRYFYEVLDIEAERLHHLIDDMLVLSQIENAKEDVETVPLRLNPGDSDRVSAGGAHRREKRDHPGTGRRRKRVGSVLLPGFSSFLETWWKNAVKYNKPQGKVTVTVQRQRNMALVKVRIPASASRRSICPVCLSGFTG